MGHLRRGEPPEEAQGEGHLGSCPEGGVAAGEYEAQLIVGHGGFLLGLVRAEHVCGLLVTMIARSFPAEAVDRPIAGGRDDPSRRARGEP